MDCPYCTVPAAARIHSEHAVAFAADPPAGDGHITIVPKTHIPSVRALPMASQQGAWTLVSELCGRLRPGVVPHGVFSIGFLDGLTAAVPVPHTVIHIVPRRAGQNVVLPECGEWIADDGAVG